jgi:hypothetical protein
MNTRIWVLLAAAFGNTSQGLATDWHVPGEVSTINRAMALAEPGDRILIAPGIYREHDLKLPDGVDCVGEGGPGATVIDGERLGRIIWAPNLVAGSRVEGLTLRNGWALRDGLWGGGLAADHSKVDLVNCRVEDCTGEEGGGGVGVVFGELSLVDCEITGNDGAAGAGIAAHGSALSATRCVVRDNAVGIGHGAGLNLVSSTFSITETIIAHNWASPPAADWPALYIEGSSGDVTNCTVAANVNVLGGHAIGLASATVLFERCVIAFNTDAAFRCFGSAGIVSVRCTNVFGNPGGDDFCGQDLGGNFSADPLFCDFENGDYSLDRASPCLPGQHPSGAECGLVGALGQGCGITPVETASWGRIKDVYRNR